MSHELIQWKFYMYFRGQVKFYFCLRFCFFFVFFTAAFGNFTEICEGAFNRHTIYKIDPGICHISDESDRYAQMALQIDPNDAHFNFIHGEYLRNLQDEFFEETTPSTEWDYSFIDYYRKAYENEDSSCSMTFKHNVLMHLRRAEARRDYYNGMIK